LADELNMQFHGMVSAVEILASDQFGNFEVFLEDERIFSKIKTGRLPNPGEVEKMIVERFM